MKTDLIRELTNTFEANAQHTEEGIEFWLARNLQKLLGYDKWDNFLNVISKAKNACEISGHAIPDHFADVGKTIQMPKSAQKTVDDLMLTRYACYLLKAKDFATEITIFNAKEHGMKTEATISEEHIK
jgi:DNA-damage-inducible protein D